MNEHRDWFSRANRTLWYVSIDRRKDSVNRDIWKRQAQNLLKDIPKNMIPNFYTRELRVLSGDTSCDLDLEECPICLEDMEVPVSVSYCYHAICQQCAFKVYRCPICRKQASVMKRFLVCMRKRKQKHECISNDVSR
ncbi:RING-finger domain-containing protein [Tetraselmis virus 1]|uniref:RING-finger domain-containing protein n=1 Tax=Tetraselmis virus 1 TaxID=2060617 RepID=A0A2P0VNI1_9VIRU|nr:RING-finger domain-containing protein [Tetraselmis virus 1]AUF82463.1 RING-finger domain-containing protein [Tetraselmis virus 1]